MAHPYQTSSLEGKHKKITSRLIQLIKESDLLPWEQSWGDKDRPVNWATLAPYQGVNAMMLAFTRNVRMYSSPFWVGYMQLKKLKGRVEKGEKGTPIIIPQIYGPVPKTFRHKEDAGIYSFIIRHVYNLDQCAIPERYHPKLPFMEKFNSIEKAEQIVSSYTKSPPIQHSCRGAFYNFKFDHIGMPAKDSFNIPEEYYGTLFHEIIHSTGHQTRLKRSMKGLAHLEKYSREELIAEFGACFLAGEAQIITKVQKNSASYLHGWVAYLQKHEDELFKAALQGARAANYVLGKNQKFKETKHVLSNNPTENINVARIIAF